MRTRSQPITAAVGALLLAATALAGCSAPAAPEATSAPPAPTSAAPTAEPTASAAPSATPDTATPTLEPEVATFETQNGTMRIEVPVDWTVEDTSELQVNYDGREQWGNMVTFVAPDGGRLSYSDGYGGDVGVATEVGVVAARETIDGFLATAFWEAYGDGRVEAHVALMPGDRAPSPAAYVALDDIGRLHAMRYEIGQDRPIFRSHAEAEEYLASDDVARILDVMATVDLIPVDQYAMP